MTGRNDRPSSIRLWLARYKPTKVRCTLKGGEVRELPTPATTRGQWSQLEHGIAACAPTYIEAFRGDECVASRSFEGDDEPEDAPASATPADPATAIVNAMPVLAQLFVDTGDRAAERHQEAYKMAFEAMLEQNKQYLQLVQVVSSRLGALERMWHQSLLDRAAASGGENDGAAMSLLGNILTKDRAAPNGATHTNGASASAEPVTDD